MTKWWVNWVIVMNYLFFDMNNGTLLYQFFSEFEGAERLKRARDRREVADARVDTSSLG